MTWWTSFFDAEFASLVLERGEDVAPTLDFLARVLDLRPGSVVLDQGCGIGRLAVPLARRGYRVIGVDAAPGYVERARARAEGVPLELFEADAAAFVQPCDAAFNWGTSFGFDEDGETSRGMLACARRSVRPGGAFALDHANVPRVLREFRPHMVTRAGDTLVVRESSLDLARGTMEQDWTYVRADGRRRTVHGRTRLAMPHELVSMFRAAGFDEVALFGGVDGSAFGPESARCIVVGRVRP